MAENERPPIELDNLVALRGMARFGCLGDACEDTCCQRWSISIDEAHYRALAERMSAPGDRAKFDEAFELRPEPERTPASFARIRLRVVDDHCPLLDERRLCSVHVRFGEAALPDVCASYPRLGRAIGDRLEVHGSMSCPEVVRQVILAEDGADLEELDARALGRVPVADRALGEDAAVVDEARGGCLMLLDQQRYPLSRRLFFLAWLAAEADGEDGDDEADDRDGDDEAGDRDGDDEATGEERTADPDAIADAVELVSSEEMLDALDGEYAAAATPSPAAAEALVGQLARLRSVVRPSFVPAIDRVLAALIADGVIARDDNSIRITSDLAPALAARAAALPADVITHLDAWLDRYARTFLLREIDPRRTSLLATIRELTLRVGTLRLLTLFHIDITSIRDIDVPALSSIFVTCVYQIARLADHGKGVRDALLRDIDVLLRSPWDLAALLALAFPPPA